MRCEGENGQGQVHSSIAICGPLLRIEETKRNSILIEMLRSLNLNSKESNTRGSLLGLQKIGSNQLRAIHNKLS